MKKILIGVLLFLGIIFILVALLNEKKHGNYDLKCTGNYAITTDVCYIDSIHVDRDSNQVTTDTTEIKLCGEASNGEGEYYFYFENDEVYLEFEEKYSEKFTERFYESLEKAINEFKNKKMDCYLEKNGNRAVLKCKKHSITEKYNEYNTKEKMKELMENKLKLKCE